MSFRLPESLILELKAKASEEGVSVTELVSRFSKQGLNLSMEDRLAALEQQLSVQDTSRQPSGMAVSQAAVLSTEAADEPLPNDSEAVQIGQHQRENQLQQRFERLERLFYSEFANFSGELAKVQAQLRMYSDTWAS